MSTLGALLSVSLLFETTTCNSLPNCEIDGLIKHIDWDILMNSANNQEEIPKYNMTVTVNQLMVTIDIELEYIGASTDSSLFNNNEYILGTTYVIGFDSFSSSNNAINKPSHCDNRISSSFNNITNFNEYWNYSQYPYLFNNIGSNNYLAYPPPNTKYWKLTIGPSDCTPIHYQATFSLDDLTHCGGSIDIIDDNKLMTISGAIYVNIVSPYVMSSTDSGFYRVYTLIKKDIQISINKQIDLLPSTNIDLFVATIIGIYINSENQFVIHILIQSADWIFLTNSKVVSTPFSNEELFISSSNTCVQLSSDSCSQMFKIIIPNATDKLENNCPPLDFSGIYSLSFTTVCAEKHAVSCQTFIDDNNGDTITLSVESNFSDNSCDYDLYNLQFNSKITLYKDKYFLNKMKSVNIADRIYVQVEIMHGNYNNYSLKAIQIDNIFLCDNVQNGSNHSNLATGFSQQTGSGFVGCLRDEVINDLHIIIKNGDANPRYDAETIPYSIQPNIIRFSFKPSNISNIKGKQMLIHSQLKAQMIKLGSTRRQLLVDSKTTQIRHFITSVQINSDEVSDNYDRRNKNTYYIIFMFGGAILFVLVVAIIILFIWCNKRSYQVVKNNADIPDIPTHIDMTNLFDVTDKSPTLQSVNSVYVD